MRTMFTPLKIAGMEVKNRTFMAPMSLGYESQDGTVNEKMEAYWLRRLLVFTMEHYHFAIRK